MFVNCYALSGVHRLVVTAHVGDVRQKSRLLLSVGPFMAGVDAFVHECQHGSTDETRLVYLIGRADRHGLDVVVVDWVIEQVKNAVRLQIDTYLRAQRLGVLCDVEVGDRHEPPAGTHPGHPPTPRDTHGRRRRQV